MWVQIHDVIGPKWYTMSDFTGNTGPESPLPKFEQAGGLGTIFGIMQMSKILYAAKSSSQPIRYAMIRTPMLAFSAINWASLLIPFYFLLSTLTEED